MLDPELSTYLDYMRAHIRAQNAQTVGQLSNTQLHDAFHTLPRPTVPFALWLERTGRSDKHAPGESAVSAATNSEVESQNARGLAALKTLQSQGFPIRIDGNSGL
jgi:hypothetical protein